MRTNKSIIVILILLSSLMGSSQQNRTILRIDTIKRVGGPGVISSYSYKDSVLFASDKFTIHKGYQKEIVSRVKELFNDAIINTLTISDHYNQKLSFIKNKSGIINKIIINDDTLKVSVESSKYPILLSGNTDFDGSIEYNVALSKNRVNFIKQLLIFEGIDSNYIQTTYYGEEKPKYSNLINKEKSKNRRVDIVIGKINSWCGGNIKYKLDTIYKSVFENDTTIYSKSGMQIFVKAGTFKPIKIKNVNFTINEYFTRGSIINNDLETVDNNGNTLLSGGMFSICPSEEITKSLKVRVPVSLAGSINNFNLYSITDSSRWELSNNKVKIVKDINGIEYYEFQLPPGFTCTKLNLDCLNVIGEVNYNGCSPDSIRVLKHFLDSNNLLIPSDSILKYKPILIKSRWKKYEKTYMVHKSKKIFLKGEIYKPKMAKHKLTDSCIIRNSIVVSIATRRNKTYLSIKPLTKLKYVNFLFWKRFVIRKNDYKEIKREDLEEEINSNSTYTN